MASWLLLIFLCQSARLGAGDKLTFADFPASPIFHGVPALPILRTAGQRKFRTRVTDGAKQGPNFAGHLTIAEWGCGTSCVSVAVVEAETGMVYDGPFGALPQALLYYGTPLKYDRDANGKYIYDALSYHLNSRLLTLLRVDRIAVRGLANSARNSLRLVKAWLLPREGPLPRDTSGRYPISGEVKAGIRGDLEITNPDVEALIRQRMEAGSFETPEDLIRGVLTSSI